MGALTAAMILCAGHGTRLLPLTEWLAKPMVPVGDAPAVAHAAERIRPLLHAGAKLVVNVFHRPDDVRAWADTNGAAVSTETELLGTAGGIAHARALLGDRDVLVWNGDIVAEVDVGALVAAHEARRSEATLVVVRRPAGQGKVGLSSDGRVVRLRDRTFESEAHGADYIGVHVTGLRLRDLMPAKGGLVEDVWIPAIARGERVVAHVHEGTFVDIGSVAEYLTANRAWLDARGVELWHSPEAHVSARIDGSVVGARAVVEANAVRSVVWPDAVVREPVVDTVVTPFGSVRA